MGNGITTGKRTDNSLGHLAYWMAKRCPQISDEIRGEVLHREFPERKAHPPLTIQRFAQYRHHADHHRDRLGVKTDEEATNVLKRINLQADVLRTIFGLISPSAEEQLVSALHVPGKRQRKSSHKRATARKTKLKPKVSSFPDDSLVEDVEEVKRRKDIGPTMKKALVSARLGQGRFRTDVLRQWGNCCCVTLSATHEAIRASHIKPWRESNDDQRRDPNNGLPLVASLDALFDAGLISFESSRRLIVSSKLDPSERKILGITGKESLKKRPTAETAAYLADHRRKHGFEPPVRV